MRCELWRFYLCNWQWEKDFLSEIVNEQEDKERIGISPSYCTFGLGVTCYGNPKLEVKPYDKICRRSRQTKKAQLVVHLLLFCFVWLCRIEGTGTLKKTQVYLPTTIYMKLRCLTLRWWHFKLPGAGIIPDSSLAVWFPALYGCIPYASYAPKLSFLMSWHGIGYDVSGVGDLCIWSNQSRKRLDYYLSWCSVMTQKWWFSIDSEWLRTKVILLMPLSRCIWYVHSKGGAYGIKSPFNFQLHVKRLR